MNELQPKEHANTQLELTKNSKPIYMTGKNANVINHAENVNYIHSIHISATMVLSIIFIVLIIIFISFKVYSLNRFNALMDSANNALTSENYIAASEYYHKASKLAPNTKNYVESLCCEADCYFIIENLQKDDDSRVESYYTKAIRLYYNIMSNDKYKTCEYYYDATAGLTFCYLYSDVPIDDPRFKKAVDILEEYTSSIKSSYNINQTIKVYNALRLYYGNLVKNSTTELNNIDIETKALDYLNKFTELYSKNNYITGTYNYSSEVKLIATSLDRKIMVAIASGEINSLHDIITECSSILDSINSSEKHVDANCYYYVQFVMGKANYFLGFIDHASRDIYYTETYNILSKVITNNLNADAESLSDSAYYCTLTGKCTEEDLKNIEKLSLKISQKTFSEPLTSEKLHRALNILAIYSNIQGIYNYTGNIQQNGLQLTEDLNPYKLQMSSSDLADFTSYYQYYHGEISLSELPLANLYSNH